MKPTLILKSLTELPADVRVLAPTMPARAMNVTNHLLRPATGVTHRELRPVRKGPVTFAREFCARASAPFQSVTPWPRGGLNE